MDIKTYGMLVRRDVIPGTSSPDGVFALIEKQDDSLHHFVGLCMFETKTISALGMVDELYQRSLDSNKWTECAAGTNDFKLHVPDPAYCSQLFQQATALGLPHVLVVFGLQGGLPLKMIIVAVLQEQQHTLMTMQKLLAQKHMPFSYVEGVLSKIPDLGKD